MGRLTAFGISLFAVASMPAVAYANPGAPSDSPVRIGVSLLGVAVAVAVLAQIIALRKTASGGAVAEKIRYAFLAVLCLAAAAIVTWAENFVQGVTFEQAEIASQVLVILAMLLLALYFASIKRAYRGFIKAMTGSERLDEELAQRIAAEEDDGA